MKLPEMNRRNQVLLLLALLIVAIPSILIYDYTQNNPKFCTSCHVMNEAFETWEMSVHGDLNCHACHEASMAESMQHVYDVLTKNPSEVTKPVEIENELCEKCHASADPQWHQVLNTAGHKVHVFGDDEEVVCIECHGMELHVFRPGKEACVECHSPDHLHGSETMTVDCTSCHHFLLDADSLDPMRDDCLVCHSNKEDLTLSMPSDAHLESTCTSCHNPHGEVTAEPCSTCHDVDEGIHSVPFHLLCTSCHVPHEEADVRETCESCHADKVEHYAPASCTNCHG